MAQGCLGHGLDQESLAPQTFDPLRLLETGSMGARTSGLPTTLESQTSPKAVTADNLRVIKDGNVQVSQDRTTNMTGR